MKYYRFLLLHIFIFSSLFANDNFIISDSNNVESTISFNIGDLSFSQEGEYHKINSNSKVMLDNIGEPELPTYGFNFAVNKNKEYEVSFKVNSFEVYENINIKPYQDVVDKNALVKNNNLYNSSNKYPEQNLLSSRKSIRGNDLYGVQLIPFEYDFSSQTLKVFTSVDIVITESGARNNSSDTPRSRVFEKIYSDFVINDYDYQDSRSYQNPSILYIMEEYNNTYSALIEPLLEWRRKQGYEVTVIDRDDINGSFNTSNIKDYIEDAYDNWDNPPEFVCLVGDANGSIAIPTYNVGGGGGWSGAYGESDYPYTLLEGNDNLPEMIIGRMSVRSTSELVTVVNKIIGYEKNYSGSNTWLTKAALVGDPYDSGISTIITNQYIEQVMEIHGGITDIRTQYSGSNFDGFMRDQINEGVAFLNYRGFYGFSNFNSDDVNQLNNGYKMPYLMTLTCDTGSFEEDTKCISEDLFTAGTAVSPKGAVAVVATAQPYTHTAFNNIVTMGMYEGIFIEEAATAGEALVYGKLALDEIYPQNPNNNVYYFAAWNNLMGDPTTQLWTSNPKFLVVDHATEIYQGSNNFQVTVYSAHGDPKVNAKVVLYKGSGSNTDIRMISYTDENGVADFILDDYTSGTVSVLSSCQNCLPEETEFTISNSAAELRVNENSIVVNDQSGNNDGFLNPSETVELSFDIENASFQSINDLNLILSSTSEYITVDESNVYLGNINPNGTINVSGLQITAAPDILDSEDSGLRLDISSTGGNNLYWEHILPLNVRSGEMFLSLNVVDDDNNNGILNRGETAVVNLSVLNTGSITLENLEGSINYNGASIGFSNEELSWNNIGVGQNINSNNFEIDISQNTINGNVISVPVSFSTSNGFTMESVFQLNIGQVSVNDPLGPDAYGYYIYDMGDTDYDLAPEYDWIEIDPDLGGDGQALDVYDNGDNLDDVTTINLPFTFTFYGVDYDRVSVCSNGWISFGDTDMTSFRNYTLPGPGGPSPIVAVFWDDLKTTNGGEIYSFYDSQNDYFVIEWSGMRTFLDNSSVQSFQIILYNTSWQTFTGDDEMKLQYKEFNNTSVGDYPVGNYDGPVVHGQYCSVGIENHLQTDGLQYTFNNSYPTAARTLSDNSALFISTRNADLSASPSLNYNYESFTFDLEPNQQTSQQLMISNDGEENSILYYGLDVSPFSTSFNQIDDYGYAWAQSNIDSEVDYNWIDISDDHSILEFDSNDGGALISLGFGFPFYENTYSLAAVMANGWLAFGGTSQEWNNGSVFDEDSPKNAILAFWDDLNPVNSDNPNGGGYVKYHSNSDRAVIWYDNVIHWTGDDRVYDFQIVLHSSGEVDMNYRTMVGNTASATIGIIDSDGDFGLEVLYNQDGFMQDNLSVSFKESPKWMSFPNIQEGQILSGSSQNVDVEVNSYNLSNGSYNGYLLINSNSVSGPASIPVNLNVGNLDLGDLNQDGVYNVLDVVTLVGVIMGTHTATNLELILSDLNQDGTVNILDVVSLVNIVLSE